MPKPEKMWHLETWVMAALSFMAHISEEYCQTPSFYGIIVLSLLTPGLVEQKVIDVS